MKTFEMYRFTHPDGSSKEWGYCDLQNGQAIVRWGPANALTREHYCTAAKARQKARGKLRKGYVYIGHVALNDHGFRPLSTAESSPDSTATPATTAKPTVNSPNKPIDLSVLLGNDQGFYF
ncbi:hypothetical protein U5801_00970 [Lamprobacter modestohalophilus]|uniref:hypothetical protein n=1 Tax=Lamprobacter modestohalophilus TaxID=1064514 RepID=UPI002ADEEB77|nr:hypothetical protein [Lamprobacter modestohalophilus]MEA1048395.1 hypothetical protein [Lamprobacter modestohalophilus]